MARAEIFKPDKPAAPCRVCDCDHGKLFKKLLRLVQEPTHGDLRAVGLQTGLCAALRELERRFL